MSFAEVYRKGPIVRTMGEIVVPPEYTGKQTIIIPDSIIEDLVTRFDLRGKRVIDPMCGVGSVVRVLNGEGVETIGIEIDPDRYRAAASVNEAGKVIHGDMLTANVPQHSFGAIVTSIPFDEFAPGHAPDPRIAERFKQLLTTDGALLIDSIPEVERDGEVWNVSEMEDKYLREHGFRCTDVVHYTDQNHTAGKDSIFSRYVLDPDQYTT